MSRKRKILDILGMILGVLLVIVNGMMVGLEYMYQVGDKIYMLGTMRDKMIPLTPCFLIRCFHLFAKQNHAFLHIQNRSRKQVLFQHLFRASKRRTWRTSSFPGNFFNLYIFPSGTDTFKKLISAISSEIPGPSVDQEHTKQKAEHTKCSCSSSACCFPKRNASCSSRDTPTALYTFCF